MALPKMWRMGIIFALILFVFAAPVRVGSQMPYSEFWRRQGYSEEMALIMSRVEPAEKIEDLLKLQDDKFACLNLARLYFARGQYILAEKTLAKCPNDAEEAKMLSLLLASVLHKNFSEDVISGGTDRLYALAAVLGAKSTLKLDEALMRYPYLANFAIKKQTMALKENEQKIVPELLETIDSTKKFAIQFGAFADSLRAEMFLRKLGNQGIKAYIEKIKRGGRKLYAVRHGSFNTRKEAVKAKSNICASFECIIVIREKQ